MNAAVKALHLRKAYQQNRVIDDLSLEVAEGERRAILAPSGCGKTTLPVSYTHLRAHETD